MCSPLIAAVIASTVVSTAAIVQQGKAAANQAEFQGAVSKNNAILAERQAKDSLKRGRLAERQKRLQLSRLEGAQRAAFSASGVALGGGSALDVLTFTAEQGELEALSIRNKAEREAAGFRARGAGLEAQASLFEAVGQQAGIAAGFGALSSVLGGATRLSAFEALGAFGTGG